MVQTIDLPYFSKNRDDFYLFLLCCDIESIFEGMKKQLDLDLISDTPSCLAEILPSENSSSRRTRMIANIIRKKFNMTHREYRKTLSELRAKRKDRG